MPSRDRSPCINRIYSPRQSHHPNLSTCHLWMSVTFQLARSQDWVTFVTGTDVHHLGSDGISLQIAPLEILDERDCCIYVHFPRSKIYLHDKTIRAIWGIMCKKSSLFDGDNVQWCGETPPTIDRAVDRAGALDERAPPTPCCGHPSCSNLWEQAGPGSVRSLRQ